MTERKTVPEIRPTDMALIIEGGAKPADGILMLMELHEISVHDLLDAYIARFGIIGVGLITLRDDLTTAINAHLK
jgi:hypothetical protein